MSGPSPDARPLIAHIVFRFGVGGLENGLVNIINLLPEDRFRHAIICLTEPGSFSQRIRRNDVELIALNKRPGKDFMMYWRLVSVLRRLRPAIVHTRNIGTLDCQFVAAATRVPLRIHGEHGWDMVDLHGTNRRYRLLRRLASPLIRWFVPMSSDLASWLERDVGIAAAKIRQIYNGVDTERFQPRGSAERCASLRHFAPAGTWLAGSVLRLEAVKNPIGIVDAYAALCQELPGESARLRLVLVGAGPLENELRARIQAHGLESRCWLAGARDDVAEIMRSLDLFVLASLNEGISNTILEAMATGLPIVATDVGGNRELITDGCTGTLVAAGDTAALTDAMRRYLADRARSVAHAEAARRVVLERFGLPAMVMRYRELYLDGLRLCGLADVARGI